MKNSILLLPLCIFLSILVSLSAKSYSKDDLPKNSKGMTFTMDSLSNKLVLTREKNCTKPGFMCDDCKTVAYCILVGEIWIKEIMEICSGDQTCLESTGQCTTATNPDCSSLEPPGYSFTCHQPGVFPNPFDCQKYHVCRLDKSVADPSTSTCPDGYYFNAKSQLCNLKMVGESCPSLGNPCNVTAVGPINRNTHMYYVCMRSPVNDVFYPDIFLCDNIEQFNPSSLRCEDRSQTLALDGNGMCTKAGRFYDPSNCNYYYYCAVVGVMPTYAQCADNGYFHPPTSTCVNYSCDDLS